VSSPVVRHTDIESAQSVESLSLTVVSVYCSWRLFDFSCSWVCLHINSMWHTVALAPFERHCYYNRLIDYLWSGDWYIVIECFVPCVCNNILIMMLIVLLHTSFSHGYM